MTPRQARLLAVAGWLAIWAVCVAYVPFWPWMVVIAGKLAIAYGAWEAAR